MGKNYADLGLLVLRLGLGAMFMFHGAPKLFGGPEVWQHIGQALGHLGIHVVPTFWGFLAACSEFIGGLCLVLGVCVRTACVFMAGTMAVAATMHLSQGDGLKTASHAIEAGIVFISLFLIGPGKFCLSRYLRIGGR